MSITTHTKWNHKFDIEKILILNNEGKNIKQIADILEIPERRFGELLKWNNITIKNKQYIIAKNDDFFEIIDSEIKAYLLGYVLADGSIGIEPKSKNGKIYSYSKRLKLLVSIDDREVMEYFKKFVCPNNTLQEVHYTKGAINRKPQIKLNISSSKLVDDLINLNIKPRKTYDKNFVFDFSKIPNDLIRHFIRGFFDGDGTINGPTVGFVTTSEFFTNQIIEIIRKEIPLSTFHIRKCKGKTVDYWYEFGFSVGRNNQKQLIYDYFYKNSNYYLQRKKIKFKINIDNTVLNKEIKESLSV